MAAQKLKRQKEAARIAHEKTAIYVPIQERDLDRAYSLLIMVDNLNHH